MFYLTVGSFPEVKQLPAQARAELLRKHIGMRFYFTLVGKAGVIGALVYALIYFGVRKAMDQPPEYLEIIATVPGLIVGGVRYFMLMAGFRKELRAAMK